MSDEFVLDTPVVRAFVADVEATIAGASSPEEACNSLEPRFAELMPEVSLDLTPEQFALLAARALAPKVPETVSVTHLHAPPVSVSEQLLVVRSHLVRSGASTFRALNEVFSEHGLPMSPISPGSLDPRERQGRALGVRRRRRPSR